MHIAALLLTAVFAQATATTGPAESVTTGSAVVTGTVDAGATYHFEYGTSANYGLRTPDAVAGADGAARQTLTNLTPRTTYHYRIVSGGVQGADRTFTTGTPPRAPAVSSRSATGVTGTSATLRASVNPRGLATTVRFEYGPTTAYGSVTPEQPVGAGTSAVVVTATIGNLAPNTRYQFRAVATSAAGVTRGGNRAFRTVRAPTAVTITPSNLRPIWGTGIGISGTVGGVSRPPVALEKQDFPFSGPFVTIATATASNRGAYTFTVPPLFRTARLRVVTRTAVAVASPVVTARVAVKVGLRKKRLRGRRYRLTGATWPAVPNGRVSLQRQSRSGRWSPVARTTTSPLSGDRSRYRFTVRRRSRAFNYRVVVVPRDGGAHVNGHSRVVRIPRR
ncbi:MAG TPA: hypothetical protein VFZ00_27835 [Solirubrobacter sp.]|nr:hypothetical protein [Solirubrobacter sp.]